MKQSELKILGWFGVFVLAVISIFWFKGSQLQSDSSVRGLNPSDSQTGTIDSSSTDSSGEVLPLSEEGLETLTSNVPELTLGELKISEQLSSAYQGLDDPSTRKKSEEKLAALLEGNKKMTIKMLTQSFRKAGYDLDATLIARVTHGSGYDAESLTPSQLGPAFGIGIFLNSWIFGGAAPPMAWAPGPVARERRYHDLLVWNVISQKTYDCLIEALKLPNKDRGDGDTASVVNNLPEASKSEAHAREQEKPREMIQKPKQQKIVHGDSAGGGLSHLKIKIAELQGDLAVINDKIETQRKRWQAANAVINQLTNNKTTPVQRNSPEHVQMYQAQVVMKEVEAAAPELKEEKARLEAMIQSLTGDSSVPAQSGAVGK